MRIKILIVVFFIFKTLAFSQNNGEYKIAILPSKFDFFEESNKYNLNSLSKFFFESQGFTVYYDTDVLPENIARDNCNNLYVYVYRDKSLFVTKTTVEVKNCKKEVLITSEVGSSREKEYNVAYTEAIREALTSLKDRLHFKIPQKKQEVKEIKTETGKEEITNSIDTGIPDKTNIISDYKLSMVPNEKGFKLVNSNLEMQFDLLKTTKSDVFIVNNKNGGIVIVKNAKIWLFEHYENGKLITETIEILNN